MHKKTVVITIEASIHSSLENVWTKWITPLDIIKWNHASDEWHTPGAENDFRQGGKFVFRMEAKDGSMGFDFSGTYTEIQPKKFIAYVLDDGRKVQIHFQQEGNSTRVTQKFEPETMNPMELQQLGWQSILNNFKKHVESNSL